MNPKELNKNEVTRIFRRSVAPEPRSAIPHHRVVRAGERFHTPCVLVPSGIWALVLLWSLYENVLTESTRLPVSVRRVVRRGAIYSFGLLARFVTLGLTDGNGVRTRVIGTRRADPVPVDVETRVPLPSSCRF